MFKQTQLHLTLWYIIIGGCISSIFSLLIFVGVSFQLNQVSSVMKVIQEKPELAAALRPPPFGTPTRELVPTIKARIAFSLVGVNILVIALAGGAGYFLAKKTLRPLEEMHKEQTQFINDASHEIRTPLTALRASIESELLDKHDISQRVISLLENNLGYVHALDKLSRDLLKLTSYQNMGYNQEFKNVQLKLILNETIYQVAPLAKQKSITITVQSDSSVISGDSKLIGELMKILLDNAIKFSNRGSEIMATIEHKHGHVEFYVRDTGIGIEPEHLQRIFNRFYQVESARNKTNNQGSGLGLSIAKRIVQMHKGTISVTSTKGMGSTFTVKFPSTSNEV